MYTYRSLEDVSAQALADCLNEAFSDYYIPIHMDEARLHDFLTGSGVDLRYSYGAFREGKMLGFLLLAYCDHAGERTVFDAGTGMIPASRGKGTFTELFRYSLGKLREAGLQRYMLEVMQQNARAIRLYERLGFTIRRGLLVLEAKDHAKPEVKPDIHEVDLRDFIRPTGDHITHIRPSFEYFTEILEQNGNDYAVARRGESYCVFNRNAGHICQMGYADLADLEKIMRYLLCKFDRVLLKNLDEGESAVASMLEQLGFRPYAKQFEMEQTIKEV